MSTAKPEANAQPAAPPANLASRRPHSVIVHPVVLLSVVDHFNRVNKAVAVAKDRVIGVLLGENHKGKIDVLNSFAVPFQEDANDPQIFFLDHVYLEEMFSMFKKVNAKEKIIGWYHTGPKIRSNDLALNEVFKTFVAEPVLVIVDVEPKELGLPTKAYLGVEEVSDDNTKSIQTFRHLSSEIGALEAEEVGVEHLLRDVTDTTASSLGKHVATKLASMKGLVSKLQEMQSYLELVASGRLPMNHQIINHMQDIFNLLPNLNSETLVRAFAVKSNDMTLAIYLGSMMRSILALHNLISNKLDLRAAEAAPEGEQTKEAPKEVPKEGKEGKEPVKEGKEEKPAKQ